MCLFVSPHTLLSGSAAAVYSAVYVYRFQWLEMNKEKKEVQIKKKVFLRNSFIWLRQCWAIYCRKYIHHCIEIYIHHKDTFTSHVTHLKGSRWPTLILTTIFFVIQEAVVLFRQNTHWMVCTWGLSLTSAHIYLSGVWSYRPFICHTFSTYQPFSNQ